MQRYLIYARKSSETEDRQILSIDSQVRELTTFARSHDWDVVATLSESRSAKAPGRETFGKMLQRLQVGTIHGLICWKLDRLARNPVDGAALIWALEQGKLQAIITPQRTFSNTGNDKFWMQLEFGMAKKYVDDLSDNVKRGNRAKLQQGWLPGIPPVGYLNDRAAKTIVPDPERFPLIRQMWDLVISGEPVTRILETANSAWGFRTPKFRRRGGRPLARSTLYKIFSNPFYYGLIIRNGESYAGAHKPMITRDEFEAVQHILGRPTRPMRKRYEFPFTGLIRCAECGCAITAEEKVNQYGSHYRYYHCTKRRVGVRCDQKTIREEKLESQMQAQLRRIQIPDQVRDWALKYLHLVEERTEHARTSALQTLRTACNQSERQLDRLTDLRLRGLIDDEEFARKRRRMLDKRLRLKQQLQRAGNSPENAPELAERAFIFANHAAERFRRCSPVEKREILIALGSNFTLKDRKLHVELYKPFEIIEERFSGATPPTKQSATFESAKGALSYKRNDRLAAAVPSWQAVVDRVRTIFAEYPCLIQWPRFCRKKTRS